MVELGRRPVSSSLLSMCTAEQTGQIGEFSTLRLTDKVVYGVAW